MEVYFDWKIKRHGREKVSMETIKNITCKSMNMQQREVLHTKYE